MFNNCPERAPGRARTGDLGRVSGTEMDKDTITHTIKMPLYSNNNYGTEASYGNRSSIPQYRT
jgi:hypothetical protein